MKDQRYLVHTTAVPSSARSHDTAPLRLHLWYCHALLQSEYQRFLLPDCFPDNAPRPDAQLTSTLYSMHAATWISWLATSLLLAFSDSHFVNDVYQQSLSQPLTLRNATCSDAEAITNIILAAFHDSLHWKYVYQFQDDHPKQHFDCFYENVRKAFDTPGVLFQVVLLPNDTSPEHEQIPVASSIWVLPTAWNLSETADGGTDTSYSLLKTLAEAKCNHRDRNMSRSDDYDKQMTLAEKRYLESVYTHPQQLYLNSLATHPDYQRRGAGSALVNAGVQFGKEVFGDENVTATLIATAAGEPLYMHLGWESMHNFSIRSLDVVDGVREEWKFDVMRHEL